MRVGVTLPQFRHEPEQALASAAAAEAGGLDGVFVYDHLWPIGGPGRPALAAFPLLGALAAATQRVTLGTLVARVGLVPDAALVHLFASLQRMVGGRLVAGLGIGDALSRPENEAYGIPLAPADERRAALARCCAGLAAHGIETWVGGTAERTRLVAVERGATLNLWAVPAAEVAAETRLPVTWGGPVPSDPGALSGMLDELQGAGAVWAVCAPGYALAPDDPVSAVLAVAEAVARTR